MIEPTERDKEKLGKLGFFFPFSLRQSSSAGPWLSSLPGLVHDPLTLCAMTHSTEYSRRKTAYHVLGSTELSHWPLTTVTSHDATTEAASFPYMPSFALQ